METQISRNSPQLTPADQIIKSGRIFVDDTPPQSRDTVCGKLQFLDQQGDTTYYSVVGAGCIWIYLTDCQGTIVSGTQHQCQPGTTLSVTGCHAFGCNC